MTRSPVNTFNFDCRKYKQQNLLKEKFLKHTFLMPIIQKLQKILNE